ncbi:hypothetical protein JD276_15170 [Leucobacter sp. CSA1]|uniref:Protein ImuA n=1 Tax=Leucobacter chromiisoli TaxID=2796471 RepID=A0A934QBZ9_9MICO|nr:hypothetical protein [Leucobacter chromiisoli]MBK0420369.1 hypothetical protein [Leucobacter chromiisoli]
MTASATVRTLQRRIAEMQPLQLDDRALPTASELRGLLPAGALRTGASYSVQGSALLALSLLSEASSSGAWCGIVGFPGFGAEAAAGVGIALDRCVLIPDPGRHALAIAGTLSETLTVVLLRAPRTAGHGEIQRVAARLRDHGSALVVMGDWPRPESALRVTGIRWSGLGKGHGRLEAQELTVQTRDRRGVRRHTVRFDSGRLSPSPQSAPVPFLHPVARAAGSGRPPTGSGGSSPARRADVDTAAGALG